MAKGKRNADDKLLHLLACGATAAAAAAQAGVSETTVFRRLRDPDFQRRLQKLRGEMVQRTAGTLTSAAGEAVRTLLDLMKGTAPAAVRLGASRSVLEIGMKVRELAELEERLTSLEERMAATDGDKGNRP